MSNTDFVRLSVSLKVLKDDCFYNLIEPKKNSKDLSDFIVKLLNLYYINDDLRSIVDSELESENDMVAIKEQFDRCATAHQKNVMATGILKDYADSLEQRLNNINDSFNTKSSKKSYNIETLVLGAPVEDKNESSVLIDLENKTIEKVSNEKSEDVTSNSIDSLVNALLPKLLESIDIAIDKKLDKMHINSESKTGIDISMKSISSDTTEEIDKESNFKGDISDKDGQISVVVDDEKDKKVNVSVENDTKVVASDNNLIEETKSKEKENSINHSNEVVDKPKKKVNPRFVAMMSSVNN